MKRLFNQPEQNGGSESNQSAALELEKQKISVKHNLEDLESAINARDESGITNPDSKAEESTSESLVNTPISAGSDNVAHDWIDDDMALARKPLAPKKPLSLLNKLILGMAGVFFIVMIVAVYIWSQDFNAIDPDKIITRQISPVEVVAGEELEVLVTIENLNDIALTNAVLVTKYGEGSFDNSGARQGRIPIGFIAPNQTKRIQVPVVVIGSVRDSRDLSFELEYSTPDNTNVYAIEFDEQLVIERSPLSVRISAPSALTVGETDDFTVSVSTTSSLRYKVLELDLEVTRGLVISDLSSNVDSLDMLESTSNLTTLELPAPTPNNPVVITGKISVENPNPGTNLIEVTVREDKLIMAQIDRDLKVTLSPIVITDDGNPDGLLGESSYLEYKARNTTEETLQNVVIKIAFDGVFSKVTSPGGRYNSTTNTITFDPQTTPQLGDLRPGESIEFRAEVMPVSGTKFSANILAEGIMASGGSNTRKLSEQNFAYQISSPLIVDAFARYRQSNTVNTGPLPPVVGRTTSYTVTLETKITDSTRPTQLRAKLGQNVSFVGDLSSGLSIEGDSLIWQNPGRQETKTLQLQLTPEANQIGSEAILLDDIVFTYQTPNSVIKSGKVLPVTTRLDRDSGYRPDDSIVQPE